MSEFTKNKSHKLSQLEFNNLLHNANEIEDFDKKRIYKSVHSVVSATPNVWKQFFTYISKLPEKTGDLYYRFIFAMRLMFSQLTSWLVITIANDSEFIKSNDIEKLWKYLHSFPRDVVKFVLNDSIYKNYKINKYIDDYVYFIFLIRNEPKSTRTKIKEDTKKILKKCKYIRKYYLDELWLIFKKTDYINELKTTNANIIIFYKTIKNTPSNTQFSCLYDLTIKNKIQDDPIICNDIHELVKEGLHSKALTVRESSNASLIKKSSKASSVKKPSKALLVKNPSKASLVSESSNVSTAKKHSKASK
jgi:hypothetical protein